MSAIESYYETSVPRGYPPDDFLNSEDPNNLVRKPTGNPAAEAKLRDLPQDAFNGTTIVDGWGTTMKFSHNAGVGSRPVVISAGPDCDFDTPEDNIRSDGR